MAYTTTDRMEADLDCDCEGLKNDTTFRDNIVEMDRKFRKLKIPSTSLDSAYSSCSYSASLCSVDSVDNSSVDFKQPPDLASIPEDEGTSECMSESDSSKPAINLLHHQDEEGDSLLHLAIIRGHAQIADDYIRGAKSFNLSHLLDLQNNFFQTPLHLAVITKQSNIVETLLRCNVAVDIADSYGNTAMHIACREGNIDIARLLFQYAPHRVILELRNYDGLSCLHIAALQNHYSLMELLLENGANINVQDGKSGRTVLHYAAEYGNQRLVNQLFNYPDLDINTVTYSGMSALNLAEGRNHIEIKEMLQLNGAVLPDYSSEESEDETSIADDFCINGQPI
uniref:Inhibitor of nuclear factor kappaB n=1 Tax=Euprymna scolopes TaxID=6613 RepID=Q32S40_EUPSC|nr:inhibitor of nuclear factor kappaB [Euprymna scolopes]